MGKSRLVYEVLKQFKNAAIEIITLQCDGILKKSMNPFKDFFVGYFEQSSENSEEENKEAFTKGFSRFLNDVKTSKHPASQTIYDNLNRTRSFLAALVDLYFTDSLYQQLEPKLRYENTLMAISDFVKGLSLIQPLILVIEDLHWMDRDSKRVLCDLSTHLKDFPVFLILSSLSKKARVFRLSTARVTEHFWNAFPRLWSWHLKALTEYR